MRLLVKKADPRIFWKKPLLKTATLVSSHSFLASQTLNQVNVYYFLLYSFLYTYILKL